MKDYRTHLEVQSTATTFDGSMTVELLPRRFILAGFFIGVWRQESGPSSGEELRPSTSGYALVGRPTHRI